MKERIAETRRATSSVREVIAAVDHYAQPRARFMVGLGINLIAATLLFCQAIALISAPL
jgi:hypothetical protein